MEGAGEEGELGGCSHLMGGGNYEQERKKSGPHLEALKTDLQKQECGMGWQLGLKPKP